MNRIELTSEEQEVLRQVLQSHLATLELEIGHTDHAEFRTVLKRRRDVIARMIDRLTLPATATV